MFNRITKLSFKNKIIFGSICLIFILLELIYYQNAPIITQRDLIVISGVLDCNPTFDNVRGSCYLEIKLTECKNRRFQTDIASYQALKEELVKTNLEKGSKVNVLILNEDSKSWLESVIGPSDLYSIICLNDDHTEYITLADYNNERYKQNHFFVAYIFWFLFAGAFILWILKSKKKLNIEKESKCN